MKDSAARVENLWKRYDVRPGVRWLLCRFARLFGGLAGRWKAPPFTIRGLGFSIPEGTVVGFLGPNGSGKSTTMKLMLSLLFPDAGEVEMLGVDMVACAHRVLDEVGAVVGKPSFHGYLSAEENMWIRQQVLGYSDPSEIRELLELVGLSRAASRKVASFSTGMKQRLAFAAAMLGSPRILLLDEPTAGMDPRGRVDVRRLVRQTAAERGCTVFVSSHLLFEIEQMCDYVVIIDEGRLIAQGEVERLLGGSSRRVGVKVPPERVNRAAGLLGGLEGVESVETAEEGELLVEVVSSFDLSSIPRAFVEAGEPLLGFSLIRDSLEELFLRLTESEEEVS